MTRTDPSAELFTPAMFHILLVLAGHECHGYGIMQEVAEQTGGEVRLAPGTLYRSIKQLVTMGMITECDERPDPALDDERRRYYQITEQGRQAAQHEAERLARLVRVAQDRHLLPGQGHILLDSTE
ncbi:MAG TPA: PadR family transcriptional regulator [Chloroflexota bacterium]